MAQISATIIADSKNEFGNRITTMVATFPRYILAELNTHRMFSRNSASSRAIPFEKMLKSVEENPFIPIAWQKDHKGMQGGEYILPASHENDKPCAEDLQSQWLEARDSAVYNAKLLANYGTTKQLCNRLLEPFMWHTVIITATEWENFFALRCPQYVFDNSTQLLPIKEDKVTFRSRKDYTNYMRGYIETEMESQEGLPDNSLRLNLDFSGIQWLLINKGQAEIHMMALAEAMWDAMNESTPKELKAGECHIPFGDNIDANKIAKELNLHSIEENGITTLENIKIKIATARCARVSYTVVGEEDKEPNYENDIKLHDRLREAGHMSPFEHCAQAMSEEDMEFNVHGKTFKSFTGFGDSYIVDDSAKGWSGNYRGFIQYRKTLSNENITK